MLVEHEHGWASAVEVKTSHEIPISENSNRLNSTFAGVDSLLDSSSTTKIQSVFSRELFHKFHSCSDSRMYSPDCKISPKAHCRLRPRYKELQVTETRRRRRRGERRFFNIMLVISLGINLTSANSMRIMHVVDNYLRCF